MHNPIKSLINNVFPQQQSEELMQAKVEIEKFIGHHPVSLFIGTHDGAKDEAAYDILCQYFDKKWIGFMDIDAVPNPQEYHHAVTIRAYDRNTNMGPFIHLPQIFVEGRHIGDLKDLEKHTKLDDWPDMVKRVNEGPSKDEPLYWMSKANEEPTIPATA